MKVITHDDIVNLQISPLKCYKWVSEILANKADVILPAKISMKPREDVFYNVMPSLLPKYGVAGVKVVTRYPSRNPALDSQILIYGYETGTIKALLDGSWITTMRTGAVAAHSIKLFGKKNFSVIGMIGLGNTARATMKVLLSIYPEGKLKVKLLKYKNQHSLFEKYFKGVAGDNYPNVEFIICNSYEEVVRGSDVIISSVTYFEDDVCGDDCFDRGCLVVPIHTRGFINCDLFFDKVFADDTGHVKGFRYFNQFKKFAEVADVITGLAEGRVNDEERIIVYNIGLSMHDINFAERIYALSNKAPSKETEQEISLCPPTKKFWI